MSTIRIRTVAALSAVVCSLPAIPSSAFAESRDPGRDSFAAFAGEWGEMLRAGEGKLPAARRTVAAATPTVLPGLQPLPRATSDRTDDFAGKQVHLFYVVPADGVDRGLDTAGVGGIPPSVASWQTWLKGQTAGRGIRVDTYFGQPDITFFRLAASDAVVASHGAFVREQIENELRPAGFNVPGRIYAVYYDGGSTWSCGGAGPVPTTGGSVTAIYLQGTPPGAPGCATNPLGGTPPGYLEFAMLHEIVHTMGFVPACAPHVTFRDHASDSRFDLMWAGSQPWGTNEPDMMQLDVGHDDYYLAGIPGCRDMSDSLYLDGGPGMVPAVPSNLTATGLSRSQIGLTWTDNSGNETGFRIERWLGTGWRKVATVPAGVTAFTHARQPALTTYFYRVRATNAAGDSASSNVAFATTLGW